MRVTQPTAADCRTCSEEGTVARAVAAALTRQGGAAGGRPRPVGAGGVPVRGAAGRGVAGSRRALSAGVGRRMGGERITGV